MPKIIVPAGSVTEKGDQGFEVELPEGVLTEAQVKENWVSRADHDRLKSDVEARLTSVRRQAAQDLLDPDKTDEKAFNEFLTAAVRARPKVFETRFPKPEDVDPEKIIAQVVAEKVQPLETEKAALEERISTLIERTRKGSVKGALAEHGVMPDSMELFEALLELRTTWDEHHETAVVLDDEGKVRTKIVDGKQVPMSPKDLVAEMRKTPKYKGHFQAVTRNGMDIAGGGPGAPESFDEKIAAARSKGDQRTVERLLAQQVISGRDA